MRRPWWGLLLAVTVFAAACGSGHSSTASVQGSGQLHADLARSSETVSTSQLVQGLYGFADDLLANTPASSKNTVISPLSIALAFSMARVGARGATAAEIDRVFDFPARMRDEAFNTLTRGLITTSAPPPTSTVSPSPGTPPPAPIVAIANALWLQQGLRVGQSFLDVLAEQYGAGVRTIDFGHNGAADVINRWVRQQTANRIRSIFDQLPAATRLVLANAIYLKASWQSQFQASDTHDAKFTRPDGSVVQVPTMHQQDTFYYVAGHNYQAVQLPYASGDLAMWILVPTTRSNPASLLSPAILQSVVSSAHVYQVDLSLPKWDFSTDVDLGQALQRMGVHQAFSDTADFSGITTGLHISQAVHRANITVDEHGTEAAAVTALALAGGGVMAPPRAQLRADHPFAFAIVDTTNNAPLFMGTVTDPGTH